jgi:hypothetical protein
MELQPRLARRVAWIGLMAFVCAGCAHRAVPTFPYTLVRTAEPTRVYESEHFRLHTTIQDSSRAGPMIQTLEASLRAYQQVTGVVPRQGVEKMGVCVFQHREQWQAFTTARTGHAAPIYLQLDRGGYTFDRFCAVRDQGEYDTLTVLAHEGLHLFISAHFAERPPPFVEEGLAVMFESVHRHESVHQHASAASIHVGKNNVRAKVLARAQTADEPLTRLRTLLTMHAGNVVGSSERTVDLFYAQAWALARYLLDPATPAARREGFERLMRDAASGALSSRQLDEGPELLERYLGEKLETIEVDYLDYCQRLARRSGEETD